MQRLAGIPASLSTNGDEMTDDTKRLINDLKHIAGLMYVPAAIKLQMITARIGWQEAAEIGDYERLHEAYNTLYALYHEWPAMPSPSSVPNEESILYAVALNTK